MSLQAMTWAFAQDVKPAAAKLCLLALANYSNENNKCWPSKARIAADCSSDKSWVCRQLVLLREQGLIEVQERVEDGANLTSIITLKVGATPSGADATGGSRSRATGGSGAEATGVVEPKRHKPSLEPSLKESSPKPPRGPDTAKFDWSKAMNPEPYDGGVQFDGKAITLSSERRVHWVEEFGSDKLLSLALTEIAGRVQVNSSRPVCAQVESQLARKISDKLEKDARYNAAVTANSKGKPNDKAARMAELMRR